uniref:Uncharacterized protein n=1 Tax=Globisporangium ultimum (strain ATCC 200006 / CBS 805.95 / DAOM BR144) TaxID=431595 RepID=K3WCB9_GLOUD
MKKRSNGSSSSPSLPHDDGASLLMQALADVLREACARGIDLATSFAHFDRRPQHGAGAGLVGADEFMAAVVDLRLNAGAAPSKSWDEHDIETCIERITGGRSRAYFTQRDFVQFFAPFARERQAAGRAGDSRDPVKSHKRTRRTISIPRNSNSNQTRDDSYMDEMQSQHYSLNDAANRAQHKKKRPLVTLPNWAHNRSKRALRELENLQQRRQHHPSNPVDLFHSHDNDNDDKEDDAVDARDVDMPTLPLPAAADATGGGLLEFPVEDDPQWRTFRVDDDTSLSYAILTHDDALDESIHSSSPLWQTTSSSKSRRHFVHGDKNKEPDMPSSVTTASFRFTVFLDAFQQLETLESFFQPFLVHFPRGKILLCGFPSRTRHSTIWTSERFAQVYADLLVYLMDTTREWLVQPKIGTIGGVSQYVIAFGTGAQAALRLLALEIPLRTTKQPRLGVFLRAQRGVLLINGLVDPRDNEARHRLHHVQRVFNSSSRSETQTRIEIHEALLANLFSEHYLTQVAPSRQAAMETFFQTRRPQFAQGHNLARLRLLLHGSIKSSKDDLRDALRNLSTVVATPFALVVVHGAHNALVPASQVELLCREFPQTSTTPSLEACLGSTKEDSVESNAPQIHVVWLKSGHEVLQERSRFMHDLFRQLVLLVSPESPQIALSGPLVAKAAANETRGSVTAAPTAILQAGMKALTLRDADKAPNNTSHKPDPTEPDFSVRSIHLEAKNDVAARVNELLAQHGLKWIQQELYDRSLEGSGTTEAILQRFRHALEQEDAQARAQQAQKRRQVANVEKLEAQRREREREELEHQLREKEAQLRIQRKEHEAQKAFFAQMEAQKNAQARIALEHELMALEDVLSQKYEEKMHLEEERMDRNLAMAQQVEEIEAERLEKDREAYQVQLQRDRLEAQHVKREELKRFQKAFEQNELVSSPVEAYMLDVSPTYDHFDDVASGGHTLTKDLVHFYELKSSQKDESAEKRREYEELKQLVATKELALRNLERVIIKAKSTGMIAKAGLGTVRIVPITQDEFQALNCEQDDKRDELARLQQNVSLQTQELVWKDQLLQRLSELIKRNEGFRDEMLTKLALCHERGNEMVLSLREEGETLFEQREVNTKTGKRLALRLHALQAERQSAVARSTEYFDTRLRIEGTTQRVLRHVLIREMDVEIDDLEKKLRVVESQELHLKAQLKANDSKVNEVAARTFVVEQSLTGLQEAINAKDVKQQVTSSSNSGPNGNQHQLHANTQTDLAEHVRRKRHADRSDEEKKWITFDFRVNFAHYYKCVDPDEVEIIGKDPTYQHCSLAKTQIERLLTLPARNCLALAFLKVPEELEAHFLLRKYTFGDGEDHFARLDRDFVLASSPGSDLDHVPKSIVTRQLGNLASAIEEASGNGSSKRARSLPQFLRGNYALLDENAPPIKLLSAAQCQLHPHKSTTHTFNLPHHAGGVGVLSLMVSIVFQGHFRSVGYQNGRIAGMLYILPPSPSNSAAQAFHAPIPIGKCSYEQDIALCTPHSLGKLVIRHDPDAKPLDAAATYQIVLGAPVFTSYSIEITGKTALFASKVLKRKRSDALKKQELLPLKKGEIQSVFLTIQLSERKKRLAKTMAHDAKDVARAAELEMIRSTKAFEEDNMVSLLSQEERTRLHTTIQSAEARFTQQCFLYAKREEEAREIEQALKELTRIHADLLDECDAMEQDLVAYRTHLPELAAALVDESQGGDPRDRNAAGAKIARELNVEYIGSGARSSKVLWAELSAMKAKLPSMMTPAERLRRKYKKGQNVLNKKEREWILLDRILYPRIYDWEERLVVAGENAKMRFHGAFPKLTKDEEQLAVLSQMEVDRILKAPWNLLQRKEIQIRKIVTKFRDEHGGSNSKKQDQKKAPTTMVALLRSQQTAELTTEEREWRRYDQLLNPLYYPISNLKKLTQELRHTIPNATPTTLATPATVKGAPPPSKATLLHDVTISPLNLTREDLVTTLNTPEEELFKLPSDLLRARSLLLKYDPQLSTNLVEAARIQHGQSTKVESVEMDIDARCRLVYQELQRAIANTRNEFMDSYVLHSTLQRFPTKVLRLELEKELDRLLMSQVTEKEEFELRNFLVARGTAVTATKTAAPERKKNGHESDDPVSDSDSDEEAQITREANAQRQMKRDNKSGANTKIRGKALKQKSVQKQRREIKDALKGRTLEERRLLLEEHELGAGGCMACRTNPCVWRPYLQESYTTIQTRMEMLQEELERVKRCTDLTMDSRVCMAAVKSGNHSITMRKSDLFDEVTLELKVWDKNLRLRAIDDEFHRTFRTKEPYFETQALHGFPQTQLRDKVQVALAREHNVLVANLIAYEVVEDILECMLEGWVFGERESERKALGFVPSFKRDGPLTMHDLRMLEQQTQQRRMEEEEQQALQNGDAAHVQGILLDKWKPIEMHAFEVNEHNKAVKKGSKMDKTLTETENALKFGLFCMTLMYFRGLSLLKKQKFVWSTTPSKQKSQKSAERARMDLEAKNVALRQKKTELFDAKAQGAQARKQKFLDQKTAAYRKRLVLETQKAKREARAAQEIQRVYRGHLGKIAGKKWMLRRREIDAQRVLERAAATTLQRAYRGRLGRMEAEEKRVELAEFISQLRVEEAIDEEEEYWRTHRIERAARKVVAFVKKEA